MPLDPRRPRTVAALPLVALLAATACAPAGRVGSAPSPSSGGALPLRLAPRPTGPEISAADLMTRLYIVADDSMLGRQAGTIGNVRGTDYIAREARRIGLEPAGENGSYFQTVPFYVRQVDPASTFAVNGAPLQLWKEYTPLPNNSDLPFGPRFRADDVQVIYGGRAADTTDIITPEQAAGKLVVLSAPLDAAGKPTWVFWTRPGIERFPTAAGVAIAVLDMGPSGLREAVEEPSLQDPAARGAGKPMGMLVTRAVAERMMGAPLAGLRPGATGGRVSGTVALNSRAPDAPARNVVAVLRGSDPALRGEYVALGAHNDHVGTGRAVDHDSVYAYNRVMRPEGAQSDEGTPTAEQWTRIRAMVDSLHRVHPARMDSVFNGADDDGTGTVSVLEIAERLASLPASQRPRRSILFVWHTGEELGLFGSQHFTDHPTVPRDSIVAQLNIDMIGGVGSGSSGDDVALIGGRRLSTELGDVIDAVNAGGGHNVRFDMKYDANGHPDNYYCRSDHYMYARYGIPIAFFFTGVHPDYHERTDEPQYINYPGMARVAGLVEDVALHLANLDHRPVVDKPRPDPHGTCRQ